MSRDDWKNAITSKKNHVKRQALRNEGLAG
jgi:hypothetical protein